MQSQNCEQEVWISASYSQLYFREKTFVNLGESLRFLCYALTICEVEWMVLAAFAQESCFNCVMIIKPFKKEVVTGRLLSVLVEKSVAKIYQIFPLTDCLVAELEYQSEYLFQMISSSSFLPCVCVYVFLYTCMYQNIRICIGFSVFFI